MAAHRAHVAAGAPPGDPYGDVFLVVDGWATLRNEYEDLEPLITDLATRGLSYGIHVVASAARWMDFRPAMRDLFGSRLELRLGDPSDSMVPRRAAANVPAGTPGRGMTADGLHFLGALPQADGTGTETADLVKAVAAAWAGPVAPRVRLLPAVLPYDRLEPAEATGLRLPIGIAEADLRQVELDFAHRTAPDGVRRRRSRGKSSFLRALATTITRRFAPEQARVMLVDYRRSLLGAIGEPHLIGYGSAAAHTSELMESVADHMRRRLPGPEVTAEQLRDRSWWSGPELLRAGRRLRPGGDRAGEPAGAAAGVPAAGPRHRPAPGAGPPVGWDLPGRLRAAHAEPRANSPRPRWCSRRAVRTGRCRAG